jgi:hypothetical protein
MSSVPSTIQVSRLDAATRQLTTAISISTTMIPFLFTRWQRPRAKIIDRLCEINGTPAMRPTMLETIVPDKRRYVADKMNEAANAFKHASSKKPDKTPIEFSDQQNFFAILMAADGIRLLGIDLIEARCFTGWGPSRRTRFDARTDRTFGACHCRPVVRRHFQSIARNARSSRPRLPALHENRKVAGLNQGHRRRGRYLPFRGVIGGMRPAVLCPGTSRGFWHLRAL